MAGLWPWVAGLEAGANWLELPIFLWEISFFSPGLMAEKGPASFWLDGGNL